MTVFYVATLARYELVEATNANDARRLGRDALGCNDERIRTVRPATDDEIDLMTFHNERNAQENA